jgi:hypothetical protein
MAYTVYKNTNTVLTTLEIGEVDSISTCLDLVGKNVNNYGEYINNNFVDRQARALAVPKKDNYGIIVLPNV